MTDVRAKALVSWATGATLALVLAACASPGELTRRHAPSARALPPPSADFAAYRAAAEATIAEANASIERPLEPGVIEDRAPFELVPERRRCPRGADGRHAKAALLLHDLGGTPYEMRDIARAFAEDCYLVRAVLLPGHGTVPGRDLLEQVDDPQWVEATRAAVASFEGEAERLVLVGFGLGATLAINHVLSAPPRSDPVPGGLVLLAPALGTETLLDWLRVMGRFAQPGPQARWALSGPTMIRCATSSCRATPRYNARGWSSRSSGATQRRTSRCSSRSAPTMSRSTPAWRAPGSAAA